MRPATQHSNGISVAADGLLPTLRDRAGASMVRFLAYAIAAALLFYVAAAAALYLFQEYIFFANSKVASSPAQAGLREATVHRFRTTDNIELTAWLVRGDSRLLAIYFHGNGASLPGRTERIRQLNQIGLSVLAVEYRGFGKTTGRPGEKGFGRDADAAYAYARDLGFNPTPSSSMAKASAPASQPRWPRGAVLPASFSMRRSPRRSTSPPTATGCSRCA